MSQVESAIRDLKAWYEAGVEGVVRGHMPDAELRHWFQLGAHVIDAVDKAARPPEGDWEL